MSAMGGISGLVLLTMSFSHFDPTETWEAQDSRSAKSVISSPLLHARDLQQEGHMAIYIRRRELISTLGAAAAWPLAARAQQSRMPVIGWLGFGDYGPNSPTAAAFRRGLIDAGYIEGRNVDLTSAPQINFRCCGNWRPIWSVVMWPSSLRPVAQEPSLLPRPQARRFQSCLLSRTTRGDTASLPI